MGFLASAFPQMVEGYDRLYAGAYATTEYVTAVRGMISALQQRYDVNRRPTRVPAEPEEDEQEEKAAEEQAAFEWE